MSLRPQTIPLIPEETARVARAAFPKGNLYLQIRDEIGVLCEDADFAALFPTRGQPAYAPWRLALITIFQFIWNLSDRAAADAVRARIDWKYALSLELEDSGFDSTPPYVSSAPDWCRRTRKTSCSTSCSAGAAHGKCLKREASSAPIRRTFWPL